MKFLIAAAGTGGHVFPGLAVGQALIAEGIDRGDVVFVGGDRLEASVYPEAGFRFVAIELAGLKRSVTLENLRIPAIVLNARKRIAGMIADLEIGAVLGMGGYVTLPAGLAARATSTPFFNAEQNAGAGLANKMTARWAQSSFTSFPETKGLEQGEWVGNPVRESFWTFDRGILRDRAFAHYSLSRGTPVVGVFGGSLGAGVLNEAVAAVVSKWDRSSISVVHLTGQRHLETVSAEEPATGVTWVRRGFEPRMDLFYAVSDLVVARAGGAVAELTATGTPSILVPGAFGSGGHQEDNARALEQAGAALIVPEQDLDALGGVIGDILADTERRTAMSSAAGGIARPDAARTIATRLIEAAT